MNFKSSFAFIAAIIMCCEVAAKSSKEKDRKEKKDEMKRKMTSTGTLTNVLTNIQNVPIADSGRRFRIPCKTGNKCGKVMKRLMVPKLAQLENTIMGIMKDLSKLPPGSRLPDKGTKTEPSRLLLDQYYKEDLCMDKLEACNKEDRRRKRILKKLFFKKYNPLRQELIGYGGRRLWGGEGNLFYRR